MALRATVSRSRPAACSWALSLILTPGGVKAGDGEGRERGGKRGCKTGGEEDHVMQRRIGGEEGGNGCWGLGAGEGRTGKKRGMVGRTAVRWEIAGAHEILKR